MRGTAILFWKELGFLVAFITKTIGNDEKPSCARTTVTPFQVLAIHLSDNYLVKDWNVHLIFYRCKKITAILKHV